MRNVAYNAICLLDEFVEVLQAEFMWLNRLRVVRDQRLVEDGRDVHGGAVGGAGLSPT